MEKKRIETIAMYLPQYHRIPENDEWWGEGFTDWVAVRKAEAFFEGHNQPRVPLGDNYYDILQKETMQWQANLAKQYGVGGFCFYHYYFKNGRKILEKPAENLLQWKEIDMPFCFCWANDTWARSWSKLEHSNPWAEKFEQTGTNGREILLEQSYGEKEEWKRHFDYLYPFFTDKRYIKVNGSPLFIIYHPEDIPVLADMIFSWNQRMMKAGQKKLYVLGVNSAKLLPGLNGILFIHAAAYLIPSLAGKGAQQIIRNGVRVYDYQEVWDNAICTEAIKGAKTYIGGFVDADETPRRGKLAFCLENVSVESFQRNLYDLAINNMNLGNEFLFLDAWNEWGEGNYLEPDKVNGYSYLEAVNAVMDKCNNPELDVQREWDKVCSRHVRKKKDDEQGYLYTEAAKRRAYCRIYDKWMALMEDGISLDTYFIKHGIRTIVIYGYMALGKHLYEQLRASSVEIIAIMDKRGGIRHQELPVYSLEDKIPECDAIIVTPVYDYGEILSDLQKKTNVKIISLEQVVFNE